MKTFQKINSIGIVPVVVIEDIEKAIPVADALAAGGINVMEITLRTKCGLDAIEAVTKNRQDMLVGAGTVLTLEQCKKCVDSGAKFIVSPGFEEKIVSWCVRNGVDVFPGCVTPTEIMYALKYGLEVVKFFPANVYGGLTALKSLSGPFGNIRFIPTGGIDEKNLKEYISSPAVFAVGGSWLCSKSDIAAGNFNKITELCKQALSIARK
jgi:2-dehydro-3-deoxyphosphogluconate aldolase/(4S)-4-hydroxy-2-oxoglutarate aldolase